MVETQSTVLIVVSEVKLMDLKVVRTDPLLSPTLEHRLTNHSVAIANSDIGSDNFSTVLQRFLFNSFSG